MVYTIGLDIGSTYTKGLILDSDHNIVGRAMKATGARLQEAAEAVVGMTLEAAGLKDSDIDYCITTGYGRHMFDERDLQVTDLTATARGCSFLFPDTHTILDIGGHFLCLEFSPKVLPLLAPLYDTYSHRILPWLGEHIAGDRDSYQYLAESIRRFPEPDALADEMSAAGFDNVTYRSLSGGIVAIHSGWRI